MQLIHRPFWNVEMTKFIKKLGQGQLAVIITLRAYGDSVKKTFPRQPWTHDEMMEAIYTMEKLYQRKYHRHHPILPLINLETKGARFYFSTDNLGRPSYVEGEMTDKEVEERKELFLKGEVAGRVNYYPNVFG